MSTQYSIFAWKIPRTEEPSRLQSRASQRVRYGREHTQTYTHTHTHTHTQGIIKDCEVSFFASIFAFIGNAIL